MLFKLSVILLVILATTLLQRLGKVVLGINFSSTAYGQVVTPTYGRLVLYDAITKLAGVAIGAAMWFS